mmetsp:Transcript_157621/g.278187  ORF Transcript_157621/g.278187 Transcript_157621/m.278187 type:complete len:252 (-) Transcript_157621:12-767(-)
MLVQARPIVDIFQPNGLPWSAVNQLSACFFFQNLSGTWYWTFAMQLSFQLLSLHGRHSRRLCRHKSVGLSSPHSCRSAQSHDFVIKALYLVSPCILLMSQSDFKFFLLGAVLFVAALLLFHNPLCFCHQLLYLCFSLLTLFLHLPKQVISDSPLPLRVVQLKHASPKLGKLGLEARCNTIHRRLCLGRFRRGRLWWTRHRVRSRRSCIGGVGRKDRSRLPRSSPLSGDISLSNIHGQGPSPATASHCFASA